MIEKLVRWMIKKYMKGWHLHHDPPKRKKEDANANTQPDPQ